MGELLVLLPRASSWKLGEDAALLEAMQGLAASITSGSKQLHERMDRLAKETASAYTRLLTTQNNFVQLSNVKFIEARVYEDSEEAVDDQNVDAGESKEEAPSEETLISEALGSGVKLLEAAFEKVEIEDSDSDEEESSTMISVMQPKNPFHIRSLPAVIGSNAWVEDDKIGLVEEEADEAEEDELSSEEEVVDKQGAEKDDSEYSQSDVEDSHSVPQPLPKSGPAVAAHSGMDQSDSEFSDDDDDDELFKPKLAPPVRSPVKAVPDHAEGSTSDHDEDSSKESDDEEGSQSNNAFSHELSKKLGLAPTQPRKEKTSDGAEEETVEQTPYKPTPKPAPTKKSLLFDSSDSEDDLFSGKPALPRKAAKPKPSMGGEKVVPPLPPAAAKPKDERPAPRSEDPSSTPRKDVPVKKSLFGSSSEDDDDDIFANITVKAAEPIMRPGVAATDDPNDSDDDIFSPKEKTSSTKDELAKSDGSEKALSPASAKKPFGGISMFGTGFNPTSVLKKEQIDPDFKAGGTDDEEDDDDIFNTIKAPATKTPLPISRPNETDAVVKLQESDEGDVMSQSDMRIVNNVDSSISNVGKQELMSKETFSETHADLDNDIIGSCSPVIGSSEMEEKLKEDAASLSIADIEAPVLTTLDTLTKSRSRGTAGRRPPSRSARKKAIEAASTTIQKEDEADEGQSAPLPSPDREIKNETKTTDKDETITAKKPIGGISMFGAGFNPAAALKSMKSRTDDQDMLAETEVEQEEGDQHMPNDGQAVSTDNEVGPPENAKPVKEDDDIFSETVKQENQTSGTLFDGLDDDDHSMFAAPSQLKDYAADDTASGSKVVATVQSKASSLFAEDDDDDLFNAPPKLEDSNEQVQTKKDIFGFDEDDSDDDLFSNMASGVKPSLNPNPLANILGDDSDDDLFSSLIPKSTK